MIPRVRKRLSFFDFLDEDVLFFLTFWKIFLCSKCTQCIQESVLIENCFGKTFELDPIFADFERNNFTTVVRPAFHVSVDFFNTAQLTEPATELTNPGEKRSTY